MDKLYWIIKYAIVFITYYFILFAWPLTVFRKFLKGKSRTFKFGFCVTVQPLLINTVVLLLGLIKGFNYVTANLLFWGVFVGALPWKKVFGRETVKKLKHFVSGTYGVKTAFSDVTKIITNKIRKLRVAIMDFMTGHLVEYTILILLAVFSMLYYSYGAFYDTSYGTGDLFTHNQWVYNLTEGQIFSSGIYPEGMHCFLALQHMCFGVDLFSCILFEAGIYSAVIIVSVYLLLKNCFKWRYSGLLSVLLFLILDYTNIDVIFTMCRFQWTLPQEFCYPAVFMCALFLLKYLKEDYDKKTLKWYNFWKNDNLLIFSAALAATFVTHFYSTMIAFFICLGIALVYFIKVIKKFVPLAVAVIAGMIVAIIPMAGAYASGIELQGSLYWAMSVMDFGNEQAEDDGQSMISSDIYEGTAGSSGYENSNVSGKENPTSADAQSVVKEAEPTFAEKIGNICSILYHRAFELIYSSERGRIAFIFTIISLVIAVMMIIVNKFFSKTGISRLCASGMDYIGLLAITIIFYLLLSCRPLGLPVLLEESRIFQFAAIFGFCAFVIPFDFIISCIFSGSENKISAIAGVAVMAFTFVTVYFTDSYHGYLMCQLTSYNAATEVARSIVADMEPESYTIVSTTDELYHVIGHGYHEELIQFVNSSDEDTYTIPTKYIYLFVEKNPLSRNQYNFYTGPSFLASEKYQVLFGDSYSSCGRDIIESYIQEAMADVFFGDFPLSSHIYATLWQRVCLMSKAYSWCQRFSAMYPKDLHIYYEDENFVCYYVEQNPRNLFELSVFNPEVMIPPNEYPTPVWPENEFAS